MTDPSKQQVEVERARRFLKEYEPTVSARVRSLSEFVRGSSQAPKPNELDNIMPDVVAQMGDREIGIELTAYSNDSNDGIKAAWGSFTSKVRKAVKETSRSYPSLNGMLVGYHPDLTQYPPAQFDDFACQLLLATSEKLAPEIIECDAVRTYTLSNHVRSASSFNNWPLLDRYVKSIRVTVGSGGPLNTPVDSSSGFASSFGACPETLAKIIDAKASKKLKQCYQNGLHEFWLLIHADREPKSSAITPLDEYESEQILRSAAATSAKASGFEKVILWDGIWGGYVDLVSGVCEAGQWPLPNSNAIEC